VCDFHLLWLCSLSWEWTPPFFLLSQNLLSGCNLWRSVCSIPPHSLIRYCKLIQRVETFFHLHATIWMMMYTQHFLGHYTINCSLFMSLAVTADVSSVHWALCCADGSCLAIEHLFGLLQQHCFLSNEEWDRLFVNGDECESTILFNSYQTGKCASLCRGILSLNSGTSLQ